MAHSSTVLSQMLKMIPRHEFEKQVYTVFGKVRTATLLHWSKFVASRVKGGRAEWHLLKRNMSGWLENGGAASRTLRLNRG
jgi:hypothetical protein